MTFASSLIPSLMVSRRRRSTVCRSVSHNTTDINRVSSLTFFVVVFSLLMPLMRANGRLIVIRCRPLSGSHQSLLSWSDGIETRGR